MQTYTGRDKFGSDNYREGKGGIRIAALCCALCFVFAISLILAQKAESDGIVADAVVAVQNYIDRNNAVAVFLGFDNKKQDAVQVSSNADDSARISEAARQYIEKYNAKQTAMPVFGIYTSGFEYRENPFDESGSSAKDIEFHSGLDIAADNGSPVLAYMAGVCTYSDYSPSYGYHVIIDHGEGLETLYAHCSSLSVKVGERVGAGDEIALVGSTGRSTAPHLHFEVRENNVQMNPADYLKEIS